MPNELLFGADFHLGSFQYGHSIREEDSRNAFEAFFTDLLSFPDANGVLLGDTGDIPHERRDTLHRIRAQAARAAESGRVTYYLRGNHDCGEPSLPIALGLPGFIDAEVASREAREAGKAFRPYGPDGPSVVALHATTREQLWERLNRIRAEELPENRSTELWLHQAIAPAAVAAFADFNAADFVNAGWTTILSGDIHKGGIWHIPSQAGSGVYVSPGSPEMTDINEDPRITRGFILHSPKGPELEADATSFSRIAYVNRPYQTFSYPAERTQEQLTEVLTWIRTETERTGMKPIVRIFSENNTWRNDASLLPVTLKLLYQSPPREKRAMVPTASPELQPTGEVVPGNALRYGNIAANSSIFAKLATVLEASDADPEIKRIGAVVLANPGNPNAWIAAADSAPEHEPV